MLGGMEVLQSHLRAQRRGHELSDPAGGAGGTTGGDQLDKGFPRGDQGAEGLVSGRWVVGGGGMG